MNPLERKAFAVLDSCFIVGYCVKETDKIELIESRLLQYAEEGRELYIPGIAVGETIYTICLQYDNEDETKRKITKEQRDEFLKKFLDFSDNLNDSMGGDISLIKRSIEIRADYGATRSYDAVFIALAEELTRIGDTVFATFDERAKNQANAHAPSVRVDFLVPKK